MSWHTWNRLPMMERIMMAATETTTLIGKQSAPFFPAGLEGLIHGSISGRGGGTYQLQALRTDTTGFMMGDKVAGDDRKGSGWGAVKLWSGGAVARRGG